MEEFEKVSVAGNMSLLKLFDYCSHSQGLKTLPESYVSVTD